MTRKTRTPAQRARRAARIRTSVTVTGAALVGLPALWVSYWHIHTVALSVGESASTAALMPLGVDGLMLVSGMAIATRKGGWLAYLGFALGLAASLAANLLSSDGSPVGMAVATWPAITVAVTSELVLRMLVGRKPRRRSRSRKSGTLDRRQARVTSPRSNGHRATTPRDLVPLTG